MPRFPRGLIAPAIPAALILAAAVPCAANVAPDAALILHVQEVSGSCATAVTDCHDVVNIIDHLGPIEVFLYLQPNAWQWGSEPVEIHALHCDLAWPESWQFVDGEYCTGTGSFDWQGPGPHTLDMEWWPCPDLPVDPNGVFPVVRLVFEADVPGRIGGTSYWNSATAEFGCPPNNFTVYPAVCWAEVGLACEFTQIDCQGYIPLCNATFADSLLLFGAPPGGSAQAETELWVGDLCAWFSVETLADWLAVSITEIENDHYRLLVSADAADLPVGEHGSWIRVLLPHMGRCLPVSLTVGDPTMTQGTSWSQVKARYR